MLKVYLNNSLVYTSSELYLGGGTQVVSITGTGAGNVYTVTIDDAPVQKGVIDFTQVPAVVSDVEEIVVLINVVGYNVSTAESKLNAAGFKNVEIIETYSNSYSAGTVISQSPTADGSTRHSTNTLITLTVSKGPSS